MNTPNFDQLKVSTKTIAVYTNVELDITKIYENLPVFEVKDVPLTKKKKRPCIKKIRAPKGSIISLRRKNKSGEIIYRGLVTKPEMIALSVLRNEMKNGITQELVDKFNNLTKMVNHHQKVLDFLNQLTCIMSVGDRNINVMIFKDTFKIVGCKYDDEAFLLIEMLWKEIAKIGYKPLDNDPPRFIFDFVMTNVDFELGFTIDRKKLNTLMNQRQYNNIIFKSQYETTGNTNVNIKWYSSQPSDFKYRCLEIVDGESTPFDTSINEYKNRKNKRNKAMYQLYR